MWPLSSRLGRPIGARGIAVNARMKNGGDKEYTVQLYDGSCVVRIALAAIDSLSGKRGC